MLQRPSFRAACSGALGSALALSLSLNAVGGAATASWLRDPALSPDGKTVAFRSNGDVYVAAVTDGNARLFAGTAAREIKPVWLPDGRSIAYSADTNGGYDVYVASIDGRAATRRLSWHSRDEVAVAVSPDGTRLLVRSGRLDLSTSRAVYPMQFESGEEPTWPRQWAGLLALPLDGGRPEPLIEPVSLEGSWDAAGARLVFSVRPGSETLFRKHERSPATWDIWVREPDGRSFKQLTHFDGQDMTPVVNPVDGLIYYLSERSGSLNVWRMPFEGDSRAEQVTFHDLYPVRDLSINAHGQMAYSYRGELYAGSPGKGIKRIPIRLPRQKPNAPAPQARDLSDALSTATLVPGGREAIVSARGELYAIERASSRRKVLFAAHEGVKLSPSLSADGRKLLVVRDGGPSSDLLLAEMPTASSSWIDGFDDRRVKTLVSATRDMILAAALSPDGRQVVYSTGTQLRLIPAGGGKSRDLLTRDSGFTEEGPPFVWHPDSRLLALPWRNLRRMPREVALLDTASGELVNVSQSGFSDSAPEWSADGRSLIWLSDRYGLRSFKGSDGTVDAVALFLDPQRQRAHEEHSKTDAKPASEAEVSAWLGALRANPARISEQRVRLTPDSAAIDAVALAPDGRFLLRLQHSHGRSEVWRQPLPEGEAARLASFAVPEKKPSEYFESVKAIQIAADSKVALVLVGGGAHWLALESGTAGKLALKDVAPGDAATEQRWVFEHMARAIERVFYRPDRLPKLNWPQHVAEYRRLLPAATEPGTFAELMQEWVGELNSSHTFFDMTPRDVPERTGSLGVIYDSNFSGEGLKLAEILRDSPLARAAPQARPGDVIVEVNGKPVPVHSDPAQWLAGTAEQQTSLVLASQGGATTRVSLKPVDSVRETELFYARWVSWRRSQTEQLSQGRLGYVHVPWMDEDTFRPMVEDILGRDVGKDGIVLDMRYNQGGWMHGPILAFLTAPLVFELRANGTVYATEPAMRAGRPIVTLVNEANYSNGFETPRALREHGVSRLVGTGIAGTGLGWNGDPLPYWEYGYGVAHDASQTLKGEDWEGAPLSPDVEVAADRAALREGRDPQLEAAVRDLLETLGKAPKP